MNRSHAGCKEHHGKVENMFIALLRAFEKECGQQAYRADDNQTEVDEGDQKCGDKFRYSVIPGSLAVLFYLLRNFNAIDYT